MIASVIVQQKVSRARHLSYERTFKQAAAKYWMATTLFQDDPKEGMELTIEALEYLRKAEEIFQGELHGTGEWVSYTRHISYAERRDDQDEDSSI